jgi:hypothetical protein
LSLFRAFYNCIILQPKDEEEDETRLSAGRTLSSSITKRHSSISITFAISSRHHPSATTSQHAPHQELLRSGTPRLDSFLPRLYPWVVGGARRNLCEGPSGPSPRTKNNLSPSSLGVLPPAQLQVETRQKSATKISSVGFRWEQKHHCSTDTYDFSNHQQNHQKYSVGQRRQMFPSSTLPWSHQDEFLDAFSEEKTHGEMMATK